MKLTTAHIDAAYENESYLGWGYLHIRSTMKSAARKNADRLLLAEANARNLSPEQLFTFLNSKPGRWYGEQMVEVHEGLDTLDSAHYTLREGFDSLVSDAHAHAIIL